MGRRRLTYHVIPYGAWTRPRMRDFREQCCDCGLIHRLDFRIVDGRASARIRGRAPWIEFRTRRDERATAAARRRFKLTADDRAPGSRSPAGQEEGR